LTRVDEACLKDLVDPFIAGSPTQKRILHGVGPMVAEDSTQALHPSA
jgi:hypothetical protein